MTRSIHETHQTYWRKHCQNCSDASLQEKLLAEAFDQLHQKRLYKRNETRRRQSAKAGTPIFVTSQLTKRESPTRKQDGQVIGQVDYRDLTDSAVDTGLPSGG